MMKGSTVRKVQRRLAKRGFAVGSVDGVYRSQTAAAVCSFQDGVGLTPDGEVGPDTMAALGL